MALEVDHWAVEAARSVTGGVAITGTTTVGGTSGGVTIGKWDSGCSRMEGWSRRINRHLPGKYDLTLAILCHRSRENRVVWSERHRCR